jgi:uncharacterized membrane-anchored protein YitT (DUF2179 family)
VRYEHLSIISTFGLEEAVYTFAIYFLAFTVLSVLVMKARFRKKVMIVSDKPAEVAAVLETELDRHVTEAPAVVDGDDRPQLICHIYRLEERKVMDLVRETDPDAVVSIITEETTSPRYR